MNTTESDPIKDWMRLSQVTMPITDMDNLVLADIHAIAKKRAIQRRYLAFGWLSFLVGAIVGLWIASPIYADMLHPTSEFLLQIGVSIALMFGFNQLWQQSKGLKDIHA